MLKIWQLSSTHFFCEIFTKEHRKLNILNNLISGLVSCDGDADCIGDVCDESLVCGGRGEPACEIEG